MESRDAPGTVRALGRIAGPAAAMVITLGAMVVPAVAQHRHRGRHDNVVRDDTGSGVYARHIRGVVTAVAPDGSTVTIDRARHERNNCLAPRTITLTLDGSTTYSTPSNPAAVLSDIHVGDAVTVAIAVPAGKDPTTVPATSVADRGAAAPITCVVRGVASGPSTTSGVTITISTGRGRHHRHHHDKGRRNSGLHRRFAAAPGAPVSLNVQFDASTAFVDIPNPTAAIDQIAPGDRLTIIWSVVPGTALDGAPAAKVIDWGPPPPIRFLARGVAASVPDGTSFGLTVARLHPNVSPAFADGSVLPVSYGTSTTFVDVANPGATIEQIAVGDRLIVVWQAPRDTPAISLPAAVRVVDLGPDGTPV